jgi:hypothetical protein
MDGGAGFFGTGLGAGSLAFATAIRVVGGNGVTVLTGRYAGVASAFAWGTGLGLGNGRGGAAWGMRLALRASAFAFLATWGLSVAAGLLVMRCCVARCCW